MPRRDDLQTVLILGSGPIVIGQGCEFDYSGVQACKALREEGLRIVLVNSNPATIMTDPAYSDRTYIEPVTPTAVRKVIEKEAALGNPIDALLPTLGGQTALNVAAKLWDDGELQRLGVELIGANRDVIHRAEDRALFNEVCASIGVKTPESRVISTLEDGEAFIESIGLPAIIRPAFTLGGEGGGVAYNLEEFRDIVSRGLRASMIGQVQVDRSLLGWKEFELEVVRDKNDNCVVVCGIENIDAMGVHTGDSITVAPIMTLTDRQYQSMRDTAIDVMRAVGVETGGSNVQFAVNPDSGDMVVVEMNPRVSRSSALASKATGFPIARIAAKLAIGYTLDELRNDVTGTTSACFEPTIDYVVTKMPRWTFEKFPEADETLTTQMKSVGEGMAIGRTFKESLQKVIRSMEVKRFGFGLDHEDDWLAHREGDTQAEWPVEKSRLTRKLAVPAQGRLYYVRAALKMGWSIERIHELTRIDPFFLDQMAQLVAFEEELVAVRSLGEMPVELLRRAKRLGYSDAQLARLYLGEITPETVLEVRRARQAAGVEPVFKLVDTCAAEFEAVTPYFYSTYEAPVRVDGEETVDDEARVSDRKKVVILGGGPNRVGQGIEFDYCCVHATQAARGCGYESVMINSNPETVSTDYDTSDLLFFEPLTLEDTLNIIERLNGDSGGLVHGVVVQFGGQTPLNLARGLELAGVPIIGTSVDSIDLAEDRERFSALLKRLGLVQPESGIAHSIEEAVGVASGLGYPVLVRPSYVLGGRGMEICSDEAALREYMAKAVGASEFRGAPVLIDKFLAHATEIDVDVVADFDASGQGEAVVCGVMEHIEHAGVHSGDSTCTVPPYDLPRRTVAEIKRIVTALAKELRVCGLMNAQLAATEDGLFIIEVNPRASRTAPFVGKAKGVAWPSVAARAMLGHSLREQGVAEVAETGWYAVKEPVFPFAKFPGVDFALGPEMRSTGEVMGLDRSLPIALAKAKMGAGVELPLSGNVFLSVRGDDKEAIVAVARSLLSMGFGVYSTSGTADALEAHSLRVRRLQKIDAGARPNVLDMLANDEIGLVINTPTKTGWATDEGKIRAMAVRLGIPMITTASGAVAATQAIQALHAGEWSVSALQDMAPATAKKKDRHTDAGVVVMMTPGVTSTGGTP
ncbi:MAG: carbamoyl-phosphate synthase large subunit [Phycisphaeraceae bacterium]|nr:carbamoyl-phosphate synthase large subunit [Phycisphaeraceae bacterium]MCB9847107.1 carbamoyl-phosphate synthase large subunit [Phycisphaeraceae bacterium]